jgi:hypothetical protein
MLPASFHLSFLMMVAALGGQFQVPAQGAFEIIEAVQFNHDLAVLVAPDLA